MGLITYLIGAGASFESLPLVREIKDRLSITIKDLEDTRFEPTDFFYESDTTTIQEYKNHLLESLRWLKDECEKHASIDTLAKKLYLKDRTHPNLIRLKFATSAFFMLEQLKKLDSRYDSFLASILINDFQDFPKQVRIISWNYDNQFEMTYANYTDDHNLSNNSASLNIHSKFQNKKSFREGFGIFKLNGTVGYQTNENLEYGIEYLTGSSSFKPDKASIKKIIQAYTEGIYKHTIYSTLSFAWEEETGSENNIIEKTKQATKDTTSLIIIGYSFPFFNRFIDRDILTNMSKLSRVYFQSKESEEVLRSRFRNVYKGRDMSDAEMIKIDYNDQFYLPPEL